MAKPGGPERQEAVPIKTYKRVIVQFEDNSLHCIEGDDAARFGKYLVDVGINAIVFPIVRPPKANWRGIAPQEVLDFLK